MALCCVNRVLCKSQQQFALLQLLKCSRECSQLFVCENLHVSSLSRSIHFHTRAHRHIRPALMESIAASLGASLVQSRLDYANSIMYGMSASNMHKLQSAQNSLTHVFLPSLRYLSASERLSYLHWLPVNYRIQFKIATFTYKTLATCQPSYLYNLLQVYHPSRALHFIKPTTSPCTIYVY